jgi:predicted MFS family arabinose efflux permease
MVVWAGESFDIVKGDPRLGLLYAGFATAGVMAGVVAPRLARRLDSLSAIWVLAPLAATASYAMLGARPWWAAALLLAAAGTFNTAGVITIVSLRQQLIPAELQSRVNTTARMIAFGAGYATGATLAGGLAERLGATRALRIVFLALITASLIAAVMPRISRRQTPLKYSSDNR